MTKPTPNPPRSTSRNGQLFTVSPDIHTESLLANASEDLLSISAIAADLADHVEGRSRSVALAISRMPTACIFWWNEHWITSTYRLNHSNEPLHELAGQQ